MSRKREQNMTSSYGAKTSQNGRMLTPETPVWKKLLERDDSLLQRIIDADRGDVKPNNKNVSLSAFLRSFSKFHKGI